MLVITENELNQVAMLEADYAKFRSISYALFSACFGLLSNFVFNEWVNIPVAGKVCIMLGCPLTFAFGCVYYFWGNEKQVFKNKVIDVVKKESQDI